MNWKRHRCPALLNICVMLCIFSLLIVSINVEASAPSTGGVQQQFDSSVSGGSVSQNGSNAPITGDTVPTEITSIALTMELPKAGAENIPVAITIADANAGYEITAGDDGKWTDASGSIPDRLASSTENYYISFTVTPQDGYLLSDDLTVMVNGIHATVETPPNEGNPTATCKFSCRPEYVGTIGSVILTNAPIAEAGHTAEAYTHTDLEAHYEVNGSWQRYQPDTGLYIPMDTGTEQFVDGNIYALFLTIDPEDGYLLDESCVLHVNDEFYNFTNMSYAGEAWIPASLAREITMVQIPADALPKAVLGESFQDTAISVPVNEESPVTASGYWVYVDESGTVHHEGSFESGKEYYFWLEVVPKARYSLSKYLTLQIGKDSMLPNVLDTIIARVEIRTSFKTSLHETELLNLPTPSVGETLQTGDFPVAVPSGAAYTAAVRWTYYNPEGNFWDLVDSAMGTDVVQNGRSYRLTVTIYPADGHEFVEPVQTKAYGILHQPPNVTPYWVIFEKEFSFQQQITDVEITGMTVPEINEVPSVAELKVPSDAPYIITDAQWFDAGADSPATIFEAGQAYDLKISIVAKEGYAFQKGFSCFLNGEEIVVSSDAFNPEYPSLLLIQKRVSFLEPLTEITLSNVPSMKVGESASSEVTIPEDARYLVDASWWVWNDQTERHESFSGIFEPEKIYSLETTIIPHAGYHFDTDATELFINGVEITDNVDLTTELLRYTKGFSSNLTPIQRIELEVQAPVAGNHSSIPPVVTLPSGVNYKLSDETMWVQGGPDNYWYLDERCPYEPATSIYFVEDGNYGASIVLVPKEGYVFGENPTVLVNGEIPPTGAVEFTQSRSKITFFFRYESAIEINEDFKDSDIPKELKDAGFDTVSKIDEHLKTAMHELNGYSENTALYDMSLMYSCDDGVTWHKADETHFPLDGKLLISLKVPEGANHADYNYTVLHMFSDSAFGKVPGTTEQPEVTERKDADGTEYLDFYVTGLSPILIGWEKDAPMNPDDNGSQGQTKPDDNGSQEQTKPDDNGSQGQTKPDDNGSEGQTKPGDTGSEGQTKPDDNGSEKQPEKETVILPVSPKTGDSATGLLWSIACAISLAGILAVAGTRYKHARSN